jgi:hypothetical protein
LQIWNLGLFVSAVVEPNRVTAIPISTLEAEMIVGTLIIVVVLVLIFYLINILPIDGRAKRICQIIVVIIAIISILRLIMPGFPV